MAEQLRRTFPKKSAHPFPEQPEKKKKKERKKVTKEDKEIINAFFTIVLAMEKKYDTKPFEWAELQREYQKLCDKPLAVDSLSSALVAMYGGLQRSDVRGLVGTQLQTVLYLLEKHNEEIADDKRIVQCLTTMYLSEKDARSKHYGRIGLAYEAFKASRVVSTGCKQSNESQAAHSSQHIRPPLVLQVLFTTFLALERQFGKTEFTWNDMVEVHRKLCGETLTAQLLEQVFGGLQNNTTPTLRGIISLPLAHLLLLTDAHCPNNKENPRMRFHPARTLSKILRKNCDWIPGEPMSRHFVEAQYAVFKASQDSVAGQSEEGQAPPLPQAPPTPSTSAMIKQEIIDPTASPLENPTQLSTKKRQSEPGKENIDDDEPKIKKEKTGDHEVLSASGDSIDRCNGDEY